MHQATPSPTVVRFGSFEVDLRSGELRKQGLKVRLQERPFQILTFLLENRGEVVTREELRKRLWPEDTFVDFDHSVNTAINKLRDALGDAAENPRFIETLPRHGYRFAAPVDYGVEVRDRRRGGAPARRGRRLWLAFGAAAALIVFGALVALNVAGLRTRMFHAVVPPRIESIAVLPFENLSGDPEQEYFADGMTEELITDLGKISALRVICRTSVMRYKGTKKTIPEIARELNVDAIVEGAVRSSGGRVRVTTNLLYAPTDRHLWAQTYERNLGDVLSLQDEVARAIARQIQIKLTPQEHSQLASARSVNPEAYRLYLQGRYYFFKRTLPAIEKSIQLFQQALEKDPNSALAYAGLSESYAMLSLYGGALPREAFPKARETALKALELDGTLAEGHAALGYALLYYDWDWSAAERELKRAIELKPGYAVVHHWYAEYLSAMRRHDQAIAEITRAQELDPGSPLMRAIGGALYIDAHRYDEGLGQCRKGIELDPNFALSHNILALGYEEKGMYREAMAEYEEGNRLFGWEGSLDRARVYAEAGKRGEAAKLLDRLWQRYERGEVVPLELARLHVSLGEKQIALSLVEKAYERRNPFMVRLNVDQWWDPLRSEPRFQALLRHMNFPP